MVVGGSTPVASESKNAITLPATVWALIDGAHFNPRNMKFKLAGFKKALVQAAPIIGCYAPMYSPKPTLEAFAAGDPSNLTSELKEDFMSALSDWEKENALLYHLIMARLQRRAPRLLFHATLSLIYRVQ